MKTDFFTALMVITGLMVAGCATYSIPLPRAEPVLEPVSSTLLSSEGRFTLHVSNQSLDNERVDIQIEVDGEAVVRDYFNVGDQHDWQSYKLRLPLGKHTMKVTSLDGEADLVTEFEVTRDHWAVVNYWYTSEFDLNADPVPKSFTFTLSDAPISFL